MDRMRTELSELHNMNLAERRGDAVSLNAAERSTIRANVLLEYSRWASSQVMRFGVTEYNEAWHAIMGMVKAEILGACVLCLALFHVRASPCVLPLQSTPRAII